MQREEIVNSLLDLLDGPQGQQQYGEGVTQLAHALQCAYFATQAGADEETVVAALLHDIGHLCDPSVAQMASNHMGNVGAQDHEAIGAAYLRRLGFSERIAQLVDGHVAAKRYLVAVNADYAAKLSPASAETLRHQGGPMRADEVAAFEDDPLMHEKLQMRQWDEMGKETDLEVPRLETYRAMIGSCL